MVVFTASYRKCWCGTILDKCKKKKNEAPHLLQQKIRIDALLKEMGNTSEIEITQTAGPLPHKQTTTGASSMAVTGSISM